MLSVAAFRKIALSYTAYPYLCFVSFLYLDLYILGDVALISWVSFVQAGRLCVLVRVWAKGEVGAPLDRFKPSGGVFY